MQRCCRLANSLDRLQESGLPPDVRLTVWSELLLVVSFDGNLHLGTVTESRQDDAVPGQRQQHRKGG
jgi:hypothetical protein